MGYDNQVSQSRMLRKLCCSPETILDRKWLPCELYTTPLAIMWIIICHNRGSKGIQGCSYYNHSVWGSVLMELRLHKRVSWHFLLTGEGFMLFIPTIWVRFSESSWRNRDSLVTWFDFILGRKIIQLYLKSLKDLWTCTIHLIVKKCNFGDWVVLNHFWFGGEGEAQHVFTRSQVLSVSQGHSCFLMSSPPPFPLGFFF